ncbi:hypothetical protein B0H11DRAFT_1933504 [Mycena galericulata]|nr:hypothetical protein B0H11DRAFT_1933504 [Mycena galericulata]
MQNAQAMSMSAAQHFASLGLGTASDRDQPVTWLRYTVGSIALCYELLNIETGYHLLAAPVGGPKPIYSFSIQMLSGRNIRNQQCTPKLKLSNPKARHRMRAPGTYNVADWPSDSGINCSLQPNGNFFGGEGLIGGHKIYSFSIQMLSGRNIRNQQCTPKLKLSNPKARHRMRAPGTYNVADWPSDSGINCSLQPNGNFFGGEGLIGGHKTNLTYRLAMKEGTSGASVAFRQERAAIPKCRYFSCIQSAFFNPLDVVICGTIFPTRSTAYLNL